MPLVRSGSEEALQENIRDMIAAGHPRDQALAAAYANQRKFAKAAGGRTPASPQRGYIVPNRILKSVGGGDAVRGAAVFRRVFPAGEFIAGVLIFSPGDLLRLGHGSLLEDRNVLAAMVSHLRRRLRSPRR
jgi:hypothetical protein